MLEILVISVPPLRRFQGGCLWLEMLAEEVARHVGEANGVWQRGVAWVMDKINTIRLYSTLKIILSPHISHLYPLYLVLDNYQTRDMIKHIISWILFERPNIAFIVHEHLGYWIPFSKTCSPSFSMCSLCCERVLDVGNAFPKYWTHVVSISMNTIRTHGNRFVK